MSLTESTILASVNINHTAPAIEVRWDNIITKNGEVISRVPHRKAYGPGQQAEFEAEVEGAEAYINLIDWTVVEASV